MIIRNAAQCAKCNDIIESKSHWDFVECSCGSIFVDGGTEYIRCGGSQDDFISLLEISESKDNDD